MYTSFKTFYKVTFITAIALAIVCGTFVSRGVQAQTTVGASVVGTDVGIEQSATVSATSSVKYQIVRPSAGETLTIGDSVAISWKRPARSPYSATVTLRLVPAPARGEKLSKEFVFAVGVTGSAYKWIVPAHIIPGTYKVAVVPTVGTWALSTSSTVTIKAKGVAKKPILTPGQQIVKVTGTTTDALKLRATFNGSNFGTNYNNKITITAFGPGCNTDSVIEPEVPADISGKKIDYDLRTYFFLSRDKACKYKIVVENPNGRSNEVDLAFIAPNGKIGFTFPQIAKPKSPGSAKFSQISSGSLTTSTDQNGYTSAVTATFPMKLDAVGGIVSKPQNSDFEVVLKKDNLSSTPITGSNVSISVVPNSDIQEGTTATVTVTAVKSTVDLAAGLYTAVLRVKTSSGIQEFQISSYVNVNKMGSQTKDPELTILPLPQPILPNTYIISPADGVQNANLNGFAVKSEGATSTISTVSVKVNGVGTSTLPGTVYLWDRTGILYASKTVPANGMVTFDSLSVHILKDRTMDFVVKGDFPSNAISGSAVTVDIVGITTAYGKVIKTSLPLVGNKITVVSVTGNYGGIATYDQIGQPTISTRSDQNGYTVETTASFTFSATAMGGNVTQPKPSDYKIVFERGNGTSAVVATSVSVVTIPNNNIAEGSIAQVTITASAPTHQMESGLYRARIVNIKTINGFTDIVTPSSVNILKKTNSVSASMLSASVGIALRMVFGSVVSLFGY